MYNRILSNTTVFNIDNNNKKCFLSSKSAYKKISEESCDSENWSNGKKCFKIEKQLFKIINIFKNITVLLYFD